MGAVYERVVEGVARSRLFRSVVRHGVRPSNRNRVLLVGPHLATDPCFAEGLRLRREVHALRREQESEGMSAVIGQSDDGSR